VLYAFYCKDRPGAADVRAANRAAHLEFAAGYRDSILVGGPLLSDDGTAMVGSLLIVELPDRAAADAFTAADPYTRAGLFESVEIRPWRKVLP
jgi:uncharacterized protein YciI